MRIKHAAWALLAAVLLTGCGTQTKSAWKADENSIYVAKDHTVKSALVYESEQVNELYNQDELAAYIGQAITDYIAQNGETTVNGVAKPPVTLESCSLQGQKGSVVFSYADPEDFVKFSEETGDNTHTVTSLVVGSVPGNVLDVVYKTPDGKRTAYREVCKKKNAVAVLIEGAGTVFTEGKILYATDGVTVTDQNRAETSEGKNCVIFKN